MIRLAIVGLCLVLMLEGLAMAQSPLTASSTVETGWTSNATDSAGGGSDVYAVHSETVSLTDTMGPALLRGTLSITQTRFMDASFENDDAVAGGIEAELGIGDQARLRLGYAVTQNWTGDDLRIVTLLIPVRGGQTDHEWIGSLVIDGADQKLTVDVEGLWSLQDKSALVGLDIAPLKLEADVGSVTARVGWERAVSPTLAALAGLEAWFTAVPRADQVLFLRVPANGGRASAGLRLALDQVTLRGSAGFDLVWPNGRGGLRRTAPYFAVAASVVPLAGVTLGLEGETGVELVDPIDGVAGQTATMDAVATLALTPAVELTARAGRWQEVGFYDTSLQRSRQIASLGLRYLASAQLSYGATLSYGDYENPGERYDKTGLAFSVTGNL